MMMMFSLLSMKATSAPTDVECLSKVLYAEARGEASEGSIAVGNTLVRRVAQWKPKMGACHHARTAYQQRDIPQKLQGYYKLVAQGLLSGAIADVTNGADSFDSVRAKPKGRITRVIGGHRFYVAQ